jgi:orotidine-5'-phosphate decarboxylase
MKGKVRQVIPALDVTDPQAVEKLVRQVDKHELIYGYKIGFSLGLLTGLPKSVEIIRKYSTKPLIYDHQKAATDIPDTGKLFADIMNVSGINEVILFPQAGPATLQAWVEALMVKNLSVIVGGMMTHARYMVSEGGYLSDEGVQEIYKRSIHLGVNRFVVPLTKAEAVRSLYKEANLSDNCWFYSPGYGSQGGDANQFDFIKTHYLIIGRSLIKADDPVRYLDAVKESLKPIIS